MWKGMIVEDQVIVRQGLKVILEQDDRISITHEAGNGREAIDLLEKHLVDFIMMDVRMPVMDGIEATKKIKRMWPHIKILMLTTFNDETYAYESLREGANGFLLKTAHSEKLIEAVASCMQGGLILHDDVAAKVMPRLLQHEKKDPLPETFTNREQMIMQLIAEGKTNKEISSRLHLSIGTIKNYLTDIMQKADVRDRTQLAIYVLQHDIYPSSL